MLRNKSINSAVGIILFLAMFFSAGCRRNYDEYMHLKEPQINMYEPQKMLVVRMTGDPASTTPSAMRLLFDTFYRLPRHLREKKEPPRARWTMPFDTPRSEWVGIFALPVPGEVKKIPPESRRREKSADYVEVVLEEWPYGEMAEILHIGPYDAEQPTIKRLNDYITSNGYQIIGPHEEIYLKGPGLFFDGDPNQYLTILRYRVVSK